LATLTVRNLDDKTRDALKARGVRNGRSMEAEARAILSRAVDGPESSELRGLGSRIHARFAGLDFEIPARTRDLPRAADFEE
jgi:plasmid stability protein